MRKGSQHCAGVFGCALTRQVRIPRHAPCDDARTQLGQKLRTHYVDTLGFLPKNFDASTILYQSTDVPRAQASARFLMSGLYPHATRNANDPPMTIFNRVSNDEIICARKQSKATCRACEIE